MKESRQSSQLQLQARFSQFFTSCSAKNLAKFKVELKLIPVYIRFLKEELGFALKVLFLSVFAVLCIYFIPFINWSFSAVGRLILIELLPYWRWSDLYNQKCLWEPKEVTLRDTVSPIQSLDCSVCENYSGCLEP